MFRNKGRIRRLAAVITAVLVLIPFTAADTYAADPTAVNVIHEEITTQTITQGVTLDNIVRFTKSGWYNLYVLKINLNQKYISVDTLSNPESFALRTSTLKLAEQSGAVAAVNGSFFTPAGTGYGFPVGGIVKSSELQSVSDNINKYGNSMASFSITTDNKAMLDFWKADLKLVSEKSGASLAFQHYNKKSWNDFTDIYVFDRKWGEKAFGATADMPDMFQMVVDNGVVTKMLSGEQALPIPENGFIVVTRSEGAKKLKSVFSVGDIVRMDITTTPDWQQLKMSISGSAILVDNGVIPEKFSFEASDIKVKSPKTALGISKDGKTLYFVTVDGRQTASLGLTLKEMAQFMQSIGAYNAINMDGGGSTTMVARPLGETGVKVMNKPSDGVVRTVINGIGVFTSAPAAELAGLIIETDDRYMFTNATRAFRVKGYDKYLNPVEVDMSQVEWSVSGVKGTFEGNVFRPSTYGEGTVKARIGDISTSIRISVLSKPVTLTLDTKSLKLPVGKSKTFKVIGTNPRGYKATINPEDLNWKVSSDFGSFSNGVFKAEKKGAGYIEVSFGDAYAYCPVSVSAETREVVERFEEVKGFFQSYPETIEGYYTVTDEQKVSGKSSGKLVYNFSTNTDVTRAAYWVLPEKGYVLDADTHKIGLNVYNDHENSGWLRAELVDADGKKQVVDFAKIMNWVGWNYVEASVESIKKPARLNRIYIVQVNPDMDAGTLYFDDLTFVTNGYPSLDGIEVPKDTPFVDEANKAVSFNKATDDSFRFGVMGQSRAPENDVEKRLTKVFADKVTKYLEVGAVVGSGSHESITANVKKKPVVATHSVDLKSTKATDYAYSVTDFKNSRFIKLDTRKNSLRLSDPDQWSKFLNDLESFKGKNVFIFMESSPENFTDKLELALFKKTLKDYRFDTLKNVCVFYKGSENKCTLEDGVRYFETAGYEVSGVKSKDTSKAQYVLVTVKGSEVTYVYKPIESS
ncbi:MAG TPA: phosphodiester glycosidase family protein [Clostridiales bacterium]|nr:phosphodiester glycosidase family protein [Clostridiales bacterium]HPP35618.1 phosphodiester glycosidase family protein [Clostridiales bacterium]